MSNLADSKSDTVCTKTLIASDRTELENSVTINSTNGVGRGLVVNAPAIFCGETKFKKEVDLGEGPVRVDSIEESTSGAGVCIKPVLKADQIDECTLGAGISMINQVKAVYGVNTDVIRERTSGAGVTFQHTTKQTGGMQTDTISELTFANGVLADGFRIKDGTAYVADNLGKEVENKGNKDQPNGYAGLDMAGKVPISSLAAQPLVFRGCWNALTNSPMLASGVGTNGDYYLVGVAGSTNLDGITSWNVGDAALFKSGMPGFWSKLSNVQSVVEVNGQTGTVSLGLDDLDDVTAPTPTNGHGLYWNGTAWVNTPVVRTLDGVSPALPSGDIDLIAGTNITITPGVNSITIASTASSAVSLTSAGGTETLVNAGTGPSLATKGLTAGTGITLGSTAGAVTITNSSPASSVALTSAGGTETLVNDGTGPALATKGLTAGTGISLSSTATAITVTNSDPASGVTLTSAPVADMRMIDHTNFAGDTFNSGLAGVPDSRQRITVTSGFYVTRVQVGWTISGTGPITFRTNTSGINVLGTPITGLTEADGVVTNVTSTSGGASPGSSSARQVVYNTPVWLAPGTYQLSVAFTGDLRIVPSSSKPGLEPTNYGGSSYNFWIVVFGVTSVAQSLITDGTGPSLGIKNLAAGTGITLTSNANDVIITSNTSGEANTSSSAGGTSLVLPKVGVNLPFKGLTAGTGITLTANANDVQISSSGVVSATGTANQVSVNNGGGPGLGPLSGAVTFSLPQDIATTSSPTFANETLTNQLRYTNGIEIGDTGTVTSDATGIALGKTSTAGGIGSVAVGGSTVSGSMAMVQSTTNIGPEAIAPNATGFQKWQTFVVTSSFKLGKIRWWVSVANGSYSQFTTWPVPLSLYSGAVTGSGVTGLTLLNAQNFTGPTGFNIQYYDVDYSSLNLVLTPGSYTFGTPGGNPMIWMQTNTSNVSIPAYLNIGIYSGWTWIIDVYNADGNNTVALGQGALAAGDQSLALGYNSSTTSAASGAIALGQGIVANQPNGFFVKHNNTTGTDTAFQVAGFKNGTNELVGGSFTAGTGIGITTTGGTVTLTNSSPASSVALTSAGGTETLVNDGTGPSLATKGLTAGSNVTLTSDANSITISATGTPSGSVITFAGAAAPSGWVLCDGTLYNGTNPIYAALWSVIGTTYGGTGISSFRVPDMRGRFAFGLGAGSATPLAGTGGTETNTLGYTNLPGFILVRRDQGGAGLIAETTGNYWNNGVGSSVITTGPASAITNLPPYLVMNYIIKL